MTFLLWFVAEVYLFFKMTAWIGWGDTFLLYFVPSLLGVLIVSSWSRMGIMTVQSALTKGQMPGSKFLHMGAIFLGGICLCFPSLLSRIFAVLLIMPGLRHIMVWRFKLMAAKKIASGSAQAFSFMQGKAGGFRFYQYQQAKNPFEQGPTGMRDVTPHSPDVLDVQAIQITHEELPEKEEKPGSSFPHGRNDS